MNYLTVPDPRNDGHVVYVHPRQGFAIELSLPKLDSDWTVECFSEFVILAKAEVKNNTKTYWFQQLYDLKAWSRVSNVQIAEVLMQYKGTVPEYEKDKFKSKTMFVVLQAKNEDQRDTLTLINPVCTKVRMAPHQLLEIVLFDNDSTELHYECLIDGQIDSKKTILDLEQIASKCVTHRLENGQFRDVNNDPHLINRHTFNLPVNPKIEEDSPIYPHRKTPQSVYKAKHFFFQMDKKCVEDVQRLPNGVYESCTLTFYDDKNMMNAEYAVDVVFGVKGANKPKLRHMGLSRRQRLMTEEHTVNGVDIGQKCLARETVFEKNRLLINPTSRNNIDFVDGEENCLVVEIAPPKVWDSKLPEDAKWEVQVDPVWQFQHRHLPEVRLTAHELDKRKTLGVEIQRFMVTPLENSLKSNKKMTFLGIVKFVCKQGGTRLTRCISFYMTASDPGRSKKSYNKPKKQLPIAQAPPPPPQVIKIQVEEIKDDCLTIFGGTSRKFQEINLEPDNSNKKKKKKSGT